MPDGDLGSCTLKTSAALLDDVGSGVGSGVGVDAGGWDGAGTGTLAEDSQDATSVRAPLTHRVTPLTL